MCHRPTDTHTGANWTDVLKSKKSICAGTMQNRLIVGVSAFLTGDGRLHKAVQGDKSRLRGQPTAFGPFLSALLVSQ